MNARSQLARSLGLAMVAALASPPARAEHPAIDLPAPSAVPDEVRPAVEFAERAQSAAAGQASRTQQALAMIDERRPLRRRPARHDNGPRAVPRPRGAALVRAQALGIGGHFTTKHMLWSRPGPELLAAVPGERPRSLLWPVVNGKWGRGFGYTRRVHTDLRHNGIDIGARAGTPIRAAAEGLVIYSDNTLARLGNCVMILHPGGWTTLYGHNLRNTVQPGWYVQRGERIALVGATGLAGGPHLHFELRDNGRWRDPAPFITGYRDPTLNGPIVELSPEAQTPHPTAPSPAPTLAPAPAPVSAPAPAPAPALAPAPAPDLTPSDSPLPPDLHLGTLAAAQRLLQGAPATRDAIALGRKFSNLLWPVKGGSNGRGFDPIRHRARDVDAAPGSPVRVAADGVVVWSGEGLRGYGHAIVVLHRDGWVTVYGSVSPEAAAESGTRVLRGEWIGRVAAPEPGAKPHLHFEWLVGGQRVDPADHFVGR